MHATYRILFAGCVLVALVSCSSKPVPPPAGHAATPPARSGPFDQMIYASAWATETRPDFAEFKQWTERYANADALKRPQLVAEGVALARKRRGSLEHLIRTAPRDALDATVPAFVRAQLPPEVGAELEQRISGRGNFLPIAIEAPAKLRPAAPIFRVELGGRNYQAFPYGRRLAEAGKYDIPLHGIASGNLLALHDSPLRVAELNELPATTKIAGLNKPVQVKAAARDGASSTDDGAVVVLADYGGEMLAFPSAAAVGHLEQALVSAERLHGPFTPRIHLPPAGLPYTGGIYSDFGDPGWTVGRKKVLVIRVDYSDRPGEPYALAEVNRLLTDYAAPFFNKMSYGATSLDITVTPRVYRMPSTAADYIAIPAPAGDEGVWVLHADARAAAEADYRIADYDRVAVLSQPLFFFFGVSQVGTARFFISPVSGEFSTKLFTHELGHSYGLEHAVLWQVPPGASPIDLTGTPVAYGDPFDDMADDVVGDLLPHYHFNPRAKAALGWLPDSAITTVRRPGLYPLYHFDDADADLSRPQALHVFGDGTRSYWIGYRHNLASHPALEQGAYVIWGYHFHTNPFTFLLDLTTPGTNPLDAPMGRGTWLIDRVHNLDLATFDHVGSGHDERLDLKISVSPSPSYIAHWGFGTLGLGMPEPPDITGGVADVAAGPGHALALKADGTVVAWGSPNTYGEATVLAGLRNIARIAAGGYHSLVVKRDSTVTGWGDNSSGQLDIPRGLRNVSAVAAGALRSAALKTDGTVVQWGRTATDATPMPAGLRNVAALAIGSSHVLALKTDGTVVGWGDNVRWPGDTSGSLDIPAGLRDVVAIAAAGDHSLALKRDGTVVAWGSNIFGQSTVPASLGSVVTIGAGQLHSVAQLADGTLVAWGNAMNWTCDVPDAAPHMVKLAGGNCYTLGLVSR